MATVKEQYDSYLDDLDPDTKLALIEHQPFARTYAEVDPISYRCGLSDFEPSCEQCGEPFTAGDTDAEAICDECRDQRERDENDTTDNEE